jgi:hypothetical protein
MKALIAFAAAASAGVAGLSYATASISEEVVVTREARGFAPGCSPRQVAAVVTRFLDALDAGDMETLDELFARTDSPGRPVEPTASERREFRWYSVTEGGSVRTRPWRHRSVYDRPELLDYFAERHRRHERMRLLALEVRPSRTPGAVGFSFVVRREANDLPERLGGRQRIAHGKAGVFCPEREIYLWSMAMNLAEPGQDYPRRVPWECPRPARWSPGSSVIACSDGPNARALADDFRVVARPGEAARGCAAHAVSVRVTRALTAFNAGLPDVFVRQLTHRPRFRAQQKVLRLRRAITEYALARYQAGEGWTATQLERVGRTASYRLSLSILHQTRLLARGTALVTVNCASGRISSWLGPGVRAPT